MQQVNKGGVGTRYKQGSKDEKTSGSEMSELGREKRRNRRWKQKSKSCGCRRPRNKEKSVGS